MESITMICNVQIISDLLSYSNYDIIWDFSPSFLICTSQHICALLSHECKLPWRSLTFGLGFVAECGSWKHYDKCRHKVMMSFEYVFPATFSCGNRHFQLRATVIFPVYPVNLLYIPRLPRLFLAFSESLVEHYLYLFCTQRGPPLLPVRKRLRVTKRSHNRRASGTMVA